MKRLFIAIFSVLLLFSFFYYWKNPLSAKVKIGDHVFYVDLAITSKERERGLSGRASMAPNRGMLFLFGSPGLYHFWMKDTRFPLDFLWIKGSAIVDFDENIQPPKGGELPIEVAPSQPIDKVLELNAGTIESTNIHMGDTVDFTN